MTLQRNANRACALLLAACASLAGTCEAKDQFIVGACTHLGQAKQTALTGGVMSSAELSLRDDVFWHRIETTQGKLVYPTELKALDDLVTEASSHGRKSLLILSSTNQFYDDGELPVSRAAVAAYARYVSFVVNHFKGRVTHYEVWNEWNTGLGSHQNPRPRGSPATYVELLKAAFTAIKQADPAAEVIGGAVAGIDVAWIDSFGKAGGFAYLDGFSVHPYVYSDSKRRPSAPTLNPSTDANGRLPSRGSSNPAVAPDFGSSSPGTPESAISRLDALKERVDKLAPGKDLSIYVTEMGWPTNSGTYGVPQAVVASYLQRFMLLARARSWLAGVWWYDLFDDGDSDQDKEQRFGLLSRAGAPKAGYNALLDVKGVLQTSGPISVDLTSEGEVQVSGELRGGKQFSATWLSTDDFNQRNVAVSAKPLVVVQ